MISREKPPEQKPDDKEREKEQQSRKLEQCGNIIESPPGFGEPGWDKIYLQGRVSKKGNIWTVEIGYDTPTVALNERIRDDLELTHSPIVSELRSPQEGEPSSLISGGVFLWINDKLVVIERDKDAPTDAGCLTGPAGRCGEVPSQTTVDELNEELIIVKTGADRYQLLGFYRKEDQMKEIISQRLQQVESAYKRIKNEKERKILYKIRGEDDVQMVNIEEGEIKDSADTVETIVVDKQGNKNKIDVISNANVFFDKENNTLEIREIVKHIIAEGEVVLNIDGEPFGRNVDILSPEKLQGAKMVPALQNYFDKQLQPEIVKQAKQ